MPSYSLAEEDVVQLTLRRYGVKITPDQIARAYARELRMSWKKSVEVARFIRGMTIAQARRWLQDVVELRRPIPLRTYKKKQAHHAVPWHGIPTAKWPVKVASRFLDLLDNLENNARFRGLDVERVVIVHAAAHKGIQIRNVMPRAFGRATPFNEQTVNVELVAVELPREAVPKRYKLNLLKRR